MYARLLIAGVGMASFHRPGEGDACEVMAETAIRCALADARLDADLVDQAFTAFEQDHAEAGRRALNRVGIGGIPVVAVGANGAMGSTALFLARQAVLSGDAECALAVGAGAAVTSATDRQATSAAQERCGARIDWLRREHGVSDEAFAQIAVKSRAHAHHNSIVPYREVATVAAILDEPPLQDRLRPSYMCPPSDGAAAVIVCTPRFAARHALRQDVELRTQVLMSSHDGDVDRSGPPDGQSTRRAARSAYALAGTGAEDIDVAEVHDSCVGSEMINCASLDFCTDDGIEGFVLRGENTYGGSVVVGPSGGMLSRGQLPGATGLAQIVELAIQLRGDAGARQVAGARTALAQEGEQGGAVSVTILRSC